MIFSASIATIHSDKKLREKEFKKGLEAKLSGKRANDCPWNGGLTRKWWLEGFNSQILKRKAFSSEK